jgi:hypothetical protein
MAVPPVGSSRAVETERLHEQTEGHEQAAEAPHPSPAADQPRPFGARSFKSKRTRAVHTARRPDRKAGEHAQDRDYTGGHAQGIPDFPDPLPGYHLYEVPDVVLPHQPLDVGPAEPYYSKGMAHGVPLEEIHHGGRPTARPEERAQLAASRDLVGEEIAPRLDPVPVVIVQQGAGARALRRAALRQVLVPAAGADPIVLVPRNAHRKSVLLLNESASPVRITADLTLTGGALLAAGMTSYREIETEDEICAYVPAAGADVAQQSIVVQGSATDPGAGGTICSIGTLTPETIYAVQWSVTLSGTVTSADANNMQLTGLGFNAAPEAYYPGVVGTYPQIPLTAQSSGVTAAVKAIAAASGSTAVYSAQVILTPLQTQDSGGTGPALVSVIELYDVAGGT